jgi:superoxide oxidase
LRLSPVTIVLHWVVALLIVAIVIIEVVPAATYNAEIVRLGNLLGVVLFLVSIYRFWARIASDHPLSVGTPNTVEVIVGQSVAVGMALAMVLGRMVPEIRCRFSCGPAGRLLGAAVDGAEYVSGEPYSHPV